MYTCKNTLTKLFSLYSERLPMFEDNDDKNSKLFICKTYCPVCLEGDTVWYRMARYGTVPSSGLQDNENEPLQFSIIKNKILPVWPVAWLTRAVRVPGSGTGHTSSQEKNVIRDFSYTAFLI